MAHARCPSGHDMWNGDGKPDVWAFRVGFIRKFDEEHPDCVMGRDGKYWELYDCVEGVLGEDDRTIIVDEIIEKGKLYRGRDIDKEELPDVELKHEEIRIISDERFD